MEEDIVERLRDPRWVKYNPEAADEIEKLRRLVESHRKWREISDKFDEMVSKDWEEECKRLRGDVKTLVALLHEAIALPQGQCPRPSTAADGWYNPHSLKLKGGSDAKVN